MLKTYINRLNNAQIEKIFHFFKELQLTCQYLGDAGLEDRNSSPGRGWNRIPDDVRGQSIDLALEETQLSPRELAVRVTDTRG